MYNVDRWSYLKRSAASRPHYWALTEGCDSTFIKKEGSTRCSEVDRAKPCRIRPRWLYEVYLFLSITEEPIEATDVVVRRGTTWSQEMMGGNAADPAGRKVASRWPCHGSMNVVDLRSGLSVPRTFCAASVASVQQPPAVARMMCCHGVYLCG